MDSKKIGSLIIIFLSLLFAPLFSGPAIAEEKPIATLTEFSGIVLIRSQGSWEVESREGLPLYSDDKIVTRIGNAVIEFEDGAILEIKSNSNLNILEKEEKKGLFGRDKEKSRSLRLMMGKLLFRTGRSNISTKLETATMVCGLSGTAGTLSIGADGQAYIQFTEGGAAYTIGDFIAGVAEDVPTELADLNPIQRAAFVAKAAADQAKRAAELVRTGQASDADLALVRANAAKAAAEETKTVAETIIENNPDEEMVEEAGEIVNDATEAIEEAEETIDAAIEAGAEEPETYTEPEEKEEEPTPGEPETYTEPEPAEEPGFDIDLDVETPLEDNRPASEV